MRPGIYTILIQFVLLCTAAVAAFIPGTLQAQATCTGPSCSQLPFNDRLDSIYYEFKNQYADTLFDDMAEAAAVANITGPPAGTINLSGFSTGVHVGMGYLPVHDVQVSIPDVATLDKVPSSGAALQPSFFLGVNLGRVIHKDYDPEEEGPPSMFSLHRLDVYISGMDLSHSADSQRGQGELEGRMKKMGVEIRYHLSEEVSLVGPLLRFRGISLGVGAYQGKLELDFRQEESSVDLTTVDAVQFKWNAVNTVQVDTLVDSYPVDIRTGIQFLYFFNLGIGVGVSFNKGTAGFKLNRTGPVYGVSEAGAVNLTDLPEGVEYPNYQQELSNLLDGANILSLNIEGDGAVPAQLTFARVFLEVNLLPVKISVEGIATKSAYGGNVGLRFEI